MSTSYLQALEGKEAIKWLQKHEEKHPCRLHKQKFVTNILKRPPKRVVIVPLGDGEAPTPDLAAGQDHVTFPNCDACNKFVKGFAC